MKLFQIAKGVTASEYVCMVLHLLLFYRLYYLYRGKVSMKEQDIFHYLFWVSPTISGILTVLQALENAIFFPETPLMVPYSCCAKTPFPMEKMEELVNLKVRIALCYVL